ncbi:MAG: glycoside hydrolase domain-containing protein [Acetobacteraceae bacterium]
MLLSRRKVLASAGGAAGSILACGARAQNIPGFGAPRDEPILGFDHMHYPGDDAMKMMRDKHGYRVTCLYLAHKPGTKDESWIRKREFLQLHGWGIFPTYVGLQATTDEIGNPEGMGKRLGDEAAKFMKDAGFPTGSVVYLDIEVPHNARTPYETYVRTWMKVVRDNKYYPGAYGNYPMADMADPKWAKCIKFPKLTSAIWTVELPYGFKAVLSQLRALSEGNPQFQAEISNWSSSSDIMQQLYKMGALGYCPKRYSHGIIRPGCIATQYKWRLQFLDIKLPSGQKQDFDLDFLKASDPSDPASIAQALNITHLI